MELTSKDYWIEYYKESSEDREALLKICGKYDSFWDLLYNSCAIKPKNILEIGAFPGRYLAYVASRYQLEPTGIDFNPDIEKVGRNMKIMGIERFEYICADFLSQIPDRKFDLVISNGFVEHFDNFNYVLDLHAKYLNDGGSMLIMIPNKRFLRFVYGNMLDRKNQLAHNLACMRLSVFREFATRQKLDIRWLGYQGGFAYRVHGKLNYFQRIIYHPVRYLSIKMNPFLARYSNKWWGGTIISILTKPV